MISGIFLPHSSTSFFEASPLNQTQSSLIWMVSLAIFLQAPFLCLGAGIVGRPLHTPSNYMDSRDMNSGPHARATSTLAMDPPPQLKFLVINMPDVQKTI